MTSYSFSTPSWRTLAQGKDGSLASQTLGSTLDTGCSFACVESLPAAVAGADVEALVFVRDGLSPLLAELEADAVWPVAPYDCLEDMFSLSAP